jgi:hypothetical protein
MKFNRYALVLAAALATSSLGGCFYSHKEVDHVPEASAPVASSSTTTTTRSDDGVVERQRTTTYSNP